VQKVSAEIEAEGAREDQFVGVGDTADGLDEPAGANTEVGVGREPAQVVVVLALDDIHLTYLLHSAYSVDTLRLVVVEEVAVVAYCQTSRSLSVCGLDSYSRAEQQTSS